MNRCVKAGLSASPGIVWLLAFPVVAHLIIEGDFEWWKIYLLEFVFLGAAISIHGFVKAVMILEGWE